MAGGAGVQEGERPWLSPRTVDDPASRPPCARAWTGGGTCVPRRSGARHGVQDSRPGRSQTAQSAILPRTARSRFCGKDGRGAVRLSPGANLEGGGRRGKKEGRGVVLFPPVEILKGGGRGGKKEAKRAGGDHLL